MARHPEKSNAGVFYPESMTKIQFQVAAKTPESRESRAKESQGLCLWQAGGD